jgi:DNA-binding MarR family transcriptional regulator
MTTALPTAADSPQPIAEISQGVSVSGIHNRLFFRLFQVRNALDRQTVRELGITSVQWAVLGALSRTQAAQGMSFTELADYLMVSRQNLYGVLKRLEREAHLTRLLDQQDRRVKKVILTPRGRKLWARLQPKIYEFYHQAMASFQLDDTVSLVHYLNSLNKGITAVNLGAAPKTVGSPTPETA